MANVKYFALFYLTMGKDQKYISQKNLSFFLRKSGKSLAGDDIKKIKGSGDRNKSVFLSHSHLDKTIVNKISILLKQLETDIYVDWLDESMPVSTNDVTARNIKEKINSCSKFLFLATYHGIRSKWCLWELGLADQIKGTSNLAILPIESNAGNWKGNEYLQIYPEMKFQSTNLESISADEVVIQMPKSEISLRNWLNK